MAYVSAAARGLGFGLRTASTPGFRGVAHNALPRHAQIFDLEPDVHPQSVSVIRNSVSSSINVVGPDGLSEPTLMMSCENNDPRRSAKGIKAETSASTAERSEFARY